MFLIDDLLLAPARGLLWMFEKVHEAARHELAAEAQTITGELGQLYRLLETGVVTEAEFEARERALLDRLDAIREEGDSVGAEEGDDDGEEDASEPAPGDEDA